MTGIFTTIVIALNIFSALSIIVLVLMQEGKPAGLMEPSMSNSYWAKNKKNTVEGKLEFFNKLVTVIFMTSALLLSVF